MLASLPYGKVSFFGVFFLALLVSGSRVAHAANLIPNPSLEATSLSSSSLPQDWFSRAWGTHSRTFTYPAPGYNSPRAVRIDITQNGSGDAKWHPSEITITPSTAYLFRNYFQSSVASQVVLRYTLTNNTFQYFNLGTPAASPAWQKFEKEFTTPPNARSLTVFHLITAPGYLITDEYFLDLATSTPPPPPPATSTNLIANPSFEIGSTDPTGWARGGWGTNTRVFTYPVTGYAGAKAAKAEMTQNGSGDAKWHFAPVAVTPGATYTYEDFYLGTVTSYLAVQFRNASGSYSYLDLATLPPANTWQSVRRTFTVPQGITSLTVFHLIKALGSLTIDNASLLPPQTTSDDFAEGMVSFVFDDGFLNTYQNAIPRLNAAGMKSVQCIISERSRTGYVTPAQVLLMHQAGHEICSHTKTHPYLTQLTDANMRSEIIGSRQDLINLGAGPVNFFVYPFGDFNAAVKSVVREAGYLGARSVNVGYNSKNSDKFELKDQHVERDTTAAEIKGWIDYALLNKKWLILELHRTDNSTDFYGTTPEILQEVIDYVKLKKMKVVTASEGVALMNP